MKLYEITGEILQAVELYNAIETDEQLATVEGQLNALQMSFNDKALGVAHYVLNEIGDVEAIKAEIERLSALKKSREGAVNWMKEYIRKNMEATNTREIDGGTIKLKLRLNPPSVIVDDEAAIPEKYKRTKIEVVVDKTAIKEDSKAGVGVVGTHIEQRNRLEIK